jgi:hypothetical protein
MYGGVSGVMRKEVEEPTGAIRVVVENANASGTSYLKIGLPEYANNNPALFD